MIVIKQQNINVSSPRHHLFVSIQTFTMDTCGVCGKTFKYKYNLDRHIRNVHEKSNDFLCINCDSSYTTKHYLQKHAEKCKKRKAVEEASPPKPTTRRRYELSCVICEMTFFGYVSLQKHLESHHGLTPVQILNMMTPQEIINNEELLKCLHDNIQLIIRPTVHGDLTSQFSFFDFLMMDFECMDAYIDKVVKELKNAAKVNVSFGFIMQNIDTGEYRYFYGDKNNYVLDNMFQLSTAEDVKQFKEKIKELDIVEQVTVIRPNTKWRLVYITNVIFDCHYLSYHFGNNDIILPNFITNKKSITSLLRCPSRGVIYNCHNSGDSPKLEKTTKMYYAQWITKHTKKGSFSGITINDLPRFEELFQINVHAFSLKENGTATALYHSPCLFDDTMHINIYNDHISYINNFPAFAKKFECSHCSKLFNRRDSLHRHESTCTKSRYIYPGGFHSVHKTVFEELEDFGLHVASEQRSYPYHCTFDFESVLQKQNIAAGQATTITSIHQPISVSVSNNINRDVTCYVDSSAEVLVSSLLQYCATVQQEAAVRMLHRFSPVIIQLQQYINFLVCTTETYCCFLIQYLNLLVFKVFLFTHLLSRKQFKQSLKTGI